MRRMNLKHERSRLADYIIKNENIDEHSEKLIVRNSRYLPVDNPEIFIADQIEKIKSKKLKLAVIKKADDLIGYGIYEISDKVLFVVAAISTASGENLSNLFFSHAKKLAKSHKCKKIQLKTLRKAVAQHVLSLGGELTEITLSLDV